MVAAVPAPPERSVAGYRLGALLGRGPTGKVYRATHEASGRACALKLFNPHRVSPAGVKRFGELAGLAAATPGSGATAILEVVHAGDSPFVAMEFVPGEGLAAVLQRGPVAWGEACSILERIARSLAPLHGAGLVHGNLKPTNLALGPDAGGAPGVQLLDVGSQALRDHGEDDSTRAHDFFPVDYQAPEQLLGEAVGPPADLYALGVILYEMIAGERPFVGSIAEIAYSHLRTAPPALDRRVPAIPAELGALVSRLLAKDAPSRPDADALLGALRKLLRPNSPPSIDDEASTQLWRREEIAEASASEHTVVAPRSTPASPAHPETVMLPPPPPPKPGDSGSITLIPADIGAEFLPDSQATTERRLRMDTSVGNNPSATVFVHPDHLAQVTAPPTPAPVASTRWWDQPIFARLRRPFKGPWPLQKKLLVLNVACMVVVIVGLAAILSSR